MKRTRALAVGIALVAASAPSFADEPAAPAITTRSFTINAQAFPSAVVPGRGGVELGTRQLATQLTIINAPASAYARSALYDNGAIELYTGPPPAGTTAECDSTALNQPLDASANPGASQLAASCRAAPTATARAAGSLTPLPNGSSGGDSSSASSSVNGDGSGDRLRASVDAAVDDLALGPLRVGSMRFHAEGAASGVAGLATGAGRVDVSDATVAGVPVLIGSDGVTVDDAKVPTELLATATQGVHDALAQGGYSDLRVVQPEVTVADDGTSVHVGGGGVFADFETNDPTQPYFQRSTFVGGSLDLAVGSDLRAPGASPAADVGPAQGGATTGVGVVASPSAAAGNAPAAATPEVLIRETNHRGSSARLVWVWLLVTAMVAIAAGVRFRRRLLPMWESIADRYLRG